MEIDKKILAAEAELARLQRVKAHGLCADTGHDWKFVGGRNAGCHEDCCCSVPVHQCTKCGDWDYGENEEADETITNCEERQQLEFDDRMNDEADSQTT